MPAFDRVVNLRRFGGSYDRRAAKWKGNVRERQGKLPFYTSLAIVSTMLQTGDGNAGRESREHGTDPTGSGLCVDDAQRG
jgi:hypothetical protein